MDWLRPLWINGRSGSYSLPRTKTVLLAATAIVFAGITVSVFTPSRVLYPDLAGDLSGCGFPALFNFGDSNSDTGGKSAAFHRLSNANGQTFFHRPSGRYCDGKLILDFIAEKLGLPYVSAYMDSMGTNFRHGANFATGGSTIQPADTTVIGAGFSPISLDLQLLQFKQFKARTEEMANDEEDSTSSNYAKTSLPRPEDFSKALYTLDIGQNDIAFGLKSLSLDESKALLPNITGILAQTVEELYELGGRTFWIHNTGPIGCLPYSLIHFTPKPEDVDRNGCIKSQNDVAEEFNKLLKQKVFKLKFELPEAALIYVDVYSGKYSLIAEAKKYGSIEKDLLLPSPTRIEYTKQGFDNPLGYCCGHYGDYYVKCGMLAVVNGTEIDGRACKDPSKYINWDGVHYSHSANELIARQVLDGSFSSPPIPITKACNNTSNAR